MATFLGSPSFLAHPIKRLNFSSRSQQQQPPQVPPSQPSPSPNPPSTSQQLSSAATPVIRSAEDAKQKASPGTASTPDSTDWIASSLSRRFGIGAGLAWVGFLAAGVVSEQVKTRFETYQQEADTRDVENEQEVVLPNNIRYYEMRVGGGSSPMKGDLVVIDLQGKVQGSNQVFVDTFRGKKPLALVLGSRPYTKGMCEGVEYVMKRMKAGGKARVVIPPSLGFGDKGADLGEGIQIPPNSTLEFVVQVDKVSIAPA